MPENTVFRILIETDRHAPLPDPSELIVTEAGSYEFAPVEFTEPGNYTYRISQQLGEESDKRVQPDERVYEINVTVIRGENGGLEGGFTLSDGDQDGKPTAVSFISSYRKGSGQNGEYGEGENAPPTGEALSPAFVGLGLSGVLLALFFARQIRRRRVNDGME